MKNARFCIAVGIVAAIIDAFIERGTILWVMYMPLFFVGLYGIQKEQQGR